MHTRRRLAVGAAVTVVVVALAVVGLMISRWVPYPVADPMATAVAARTVHGLHVFTVPQGDTVAVLVADPQHLDGEPLWWCPDEQVFFAPSHGEMFSRDGIAFAGPAARNLDRLAVEPLSDGMVRIDNQVIEGGAADTRGPPDEGFGEHLTPDQVNTYRRDTGNFCADPIAGEGW